MARFFLSLVGLTAIGGLLALPSVASAADPVLLPALPLLWAKAWAIGYSLAFLGVLLGLIPICFPSRRKAEQTDD